MEQGCCVVGCDARDVGGTKGRKLYAFPGKPEERVGEWGRFVRVGRGIAKEASAWLPGPEDRICSAHFSRGVKSEDPRKSNYNPTIHPGAFRTKQVKYDLNDLVSWWSGKGHLVFTDLMPVVEVVPEDHLSSREGTSPRLREFKSLTLLEVDVKDDSSARISRSIRVERDLRFRAYLEGKPVPAKAILGEGEVECQFGNLYEFVEGLRNFVKLNVCVGVSTGMIHKWPLNLKGVVREVVGPGGVLVKRVVADGCEGIVAKKVCRVCQRLWGYLFNWQKRRGGDAGESDVGVVVEKEETLEDKVKRLERSFEIYKVENDELRVRNKALAHRVDVLRLALRQEGGGGDVEVVGVVDKSVGVKRKVDDGAALPDTHGPLRVIEPSKILEQQGVECGTIVRPVVRRKVLKLTRRRLESVMPCLLSGSVRSGGLIPVPVDRVPDIERAVGEEFK